MNVTRQQMIDALVHEDFFVRCTMLSYFGSQKDEDIAVTRKAIEAIELYGWEHAFRFPHELRDLSLDTKSTNWLVQQILDMNMSPGNRNTGSHLIHWFTHAASVDSVASHIESIEALPVSDEEKEIAARRKQLFGQKDWSDLEKARFRLGLANADAETCLKALDDLIKEMAKVPESRFPHSEVARAEFWIERLAQLKPDLYGTLKNWISDYWLESDAPDQDQWRAGLAIILAGKLKIEKIVPELLEMLETDWDWWNESIERAIQEIGSEEAAKMVIEKFHELPEHGQAFASGALENMQIGMLAPEVARLLASERIDKDWIRINLAMTLIRQADADSLAVARAVYDEDPDDPERMHLVEYLYAYHIITDTPDPVLEKWKRKIQRLDKIASSKELQSTLDNLLHSSSQELVIPDRKLLTAGRNDPCPCGSGKKYKKCCLTKN